MVTIMTVASKASGINNEAIRSMRFNVQAISFPVGFLVGSS